MKSILIEGTLAGIGLLIMSYLTRRLDKKQSFVLALAVSVFSVLLFFKFEDSKSVQIIFAILFAGVWINVIEKTRKAKTQN